MAFSVSQREALRKCIAVLDRSIGELTEARYEFAQALLASESAERDSTPAERRTA